MEEKRRKTNKGRGKIKEVGKEVNWRKKGSLGGWEKRESKS